MRKSDLYFTLLLIPLDALMMLAAVVSAYYIRAKVEIPPVIYLPSILEYLKYFLFILPVWLFIFALNGLYTISETPRGYLDEIIKIFIASSACVMLVVGVIFLSRTFFFSRLIIIYSWILLPIFVSLARYLFYLLKRWLFKFKIGLKRVILFGQSHLTNPLKKEFSENKKLGFEVVAQTSSLLPLEKLVKKFKPEEIIQTQPNLPEEKIVKLIDFCENKKIGFRFIPNLFEIKTSHFALSQISGIPLFRLKRTPLEGWGRIGKRAFDIFFSLFGLIFLSPLFLLLSLLIKIDSKGPVFFRHQRIGSLGQKFEILKFRSMIKEAPRLYPKLAGQKIKKSLFYPKIENDPRITKLGKVLRRLGLDELPQLYNVLKGEMSLVGPRPLLPEEFERVSSWEKKYRWISYVKPGMTGLWQVSGRTELSDEERINLDLYYLENWSLFLDLSILFKTFFVLFKKGAT